MMADISWSQIRNLQTQKYVQGMYVWLFLVPVAAKMLENISETVSLTILGERFVIGTSLPFSWPLFYSSALLFVVGHLVWFVYCPAIVKEHRNYASFDATGKGLRELKLYCELERLIWSDIELMAQKSSPLYKSSVVQSIPVEVKLAFAELYAISNLQRPRLRMLSMGFFLLGGTLLALVVMDNTWTVLKMVWR